MGTNSSYQDIFAVFVAGVKESEAQWNSINALWYS